MVHMCASPHSSPSVPSMMCEQVVAATRGLDEVVLMETVVFLVHTKEHLCNFDLAAIAREGLSAAVQAASTAIAGRIRYR